MNLNEIRAFLQTMHDYSAVKINQVFTTESGQNLSVRCLPDTATFEVTNSLTQEIFLNDSIEETTAYIAAFLDSRDLISNS